MLKIFTVSLMVIINFSVNSASGILAQYIYDDSENSNKIIVQYLTKDNFGSTSTNNNNF